MYYCLIQRLKLKKLTNTEVELKKSVACKTSVYIIIYKKPFDSSFIVSKPV